MILNGYSKPEQHALFSASKGAWINDKDDDQIIRRYINSFSSSIGTSTHKFAKACIDDDIRLNKGDKKILLYHLLNDSEFNIPKEVIDIDFLFNNVRNYVNDAIGFGMDTEVKIEYSDLSFGTADAICYRDNFLRIHDLKTGRLPVHIDQLLIYAAYFCLSHRIQPKDLRGSELRVYQNSEIIFHNPKPEEIEAIINQSIRCNKIINRFRGVEIII